VLVPSNPPHLHSQTPKQARGRNIFTHRRTTHGFSKQGSRLDQIRAHYASKALCEQATTPTEEQVQLLMANDTVGYEPSRQHVINEYLEYSKQSFKNLKRKRWIIVNEIIEGV